MINPDRERTQIAQAPALEVINGEREDREGLSEK